MPEQWRLMDSERNLLFGVLALRLERISPEQLAEVCIAWSMRRDRPELADLLVERGWLDPTERQEIETQLGAVADGEPVRLSPVPTGPASSSKASLADMEIPGVRGDRYTIQRFHGEGGAGRVFVALDHILNREVALKEAKPDLSRRSEARRRLLREVQITGQLEHPGIVPIYDLAREPDGDTPFYTMRLLRGQTLQVAIADYHERRAEGSVGPLELPRLLHALISICNAIGYAHSRGVLHRDLKPENVLLGRFGEVVLLDWGLAKVVSDSQGDDGGEVVDLTSDASSHETVEGIAVGTPAYMAPEQVDGQTGRIDRRTDVYGVGAILFELLTGRAPHVGEDSAEVLNRIRSGPSPRARDIDPGVPAALDAVCSKAMAKDPEDRYSSVSRVADELERFLADEPVMAYRGGWVHRTRLWARRNPAWSRAAAAALLITIAVTTTAAIWLGHMATSERAAREQSLSLAAKFAAGKIENEIHLRWHHLQEAASDAELHGHLRRLQGYQDIRQYPQRPALEDWLKVQHRKYSSFVEATSWFLEDERGLHLGRSPPDEDIVGVNFAYRDYFHGEGRDYPEEAEKEPIRDFHRSNVFRSRATGALIVAFTTPVWDRGNGDRRVIGVLGMTVELGSFDGLQTTLGDDQLAVLVETEEYVIDDQQRPGVVLHHPGLTEAGGRGQLFSLDADLVNRLRVLRDLEAGNRTRSGRQRVQILPGAFASDYRDPIGGRFAGEWLAAFEPVIVREGPDVAGDTGWIVIVQERK